MLKNIKKILYNKYCAYTCITISYLLIDLFLRYFVINSIYFYSIYNISPILFNLSIITFNLFIINLLNKKWSLIYYIITFLYNFIMAGVQYFHYKILGTCFTFSELFLAGEGFTYLDAIAVLDAALMTLPGDTQITQQMHIYEKAYADQILADTLENAIEDAYKLTKKIHFANAYCRKDIGQKALAAKEGK